VSSGTLGCTEFDNVKAGGWFVSVVSDQVPVPGYPGSTAADRLDHWTIETSDMSVSGEAEGTHTTSLTDPVAHFDVPLDLTAGVVTVTAFMV